MTEAHACPCGRPAPNANLCNGCAEHTRDRLLAIADRWPTLTNALTWQDTPHAADTPPKPRHVDPDEGAGNPTGLTINETAAHAMRNAANVIHYIASVLHDEYDDHGKPFNPPATNGTLDDIPKLARWIGMWHMAYIAHKLPDEGTVEAIRDDVKRAEHLTYRAIHPSGIKWTPVNLACTDHATTDLGERTPCPGNMWAKVGGDLMPDLVCDADPEHVINPDTWERQGWKRRLGQATGAARLLERIAR